MLSQTIIATLFCVASAATTGSIPPPPLPPQTGASSPAVSTSYKSVAVNVLSPGVPAPPVQSGCQCDGCSYQTVSPYQAVLYYPNGACPVGYTMKVNTNNNKANGSELYVQSYNLYDNTNIFSECSSSSYASCYDAPTYCGSKGVTPAVYVYCMSEQNCAYYNTVNFYCEYDN
eukprot:Pgem_evm1s1358